MSWSVSAMGMPEPVRASLAAQFANAKYFADAFAAERSTIEAIEKAVNSQLDLLIRQCDHRTAVRVISAGSVGAGPAADAALSLRIECLPDFLAHARVEESDEA